METMFRTSSDHLPKFLGSKDISATAPSFRIYYGGVSGSVPFLWESQPGTPKHSILCDPVANSLPPPLTPPPSYYYRQNSDDANKKRSFTRYRLLRNLWSKITFVSRASPTVDYSSSLSSSSSSSAGSYSSAPNTPSNLKRRSSHQRRRNWASFDHHDVSRRSSNEDGEIIIGSGWNSGNQACFGFSKSGNTRGKYAAVSETMGRGST